MPVARARSCCGNHVATTRLLTGKQGASLTPRPKRNSSNDLRPTAKPCINVKNDQNVNARKYVTLLIGFNI